MNDQRPPIEHVYIHVPLCLQKCGYCSFYSQPSAQVNRALYLGTLLDEIRLYKQYYDIEPSTMYLGGGTPSLLSSSEIASILALFGTTPATEITLEANPATITADYARELRGTGITRVSLGAQSFVESELRWLGRVHSAESIWRTAAILQQSGFASFGLDLMYGLPGQAISLLDVSLDAVERLRPGSVSLYCLGLEPDAPLWSQRHLLPDDDAVADMYDHLCLRLPRMGYEAYEISNFARAGHSSRHNMAYWDGAHYLGFGPAAAGNVEGARYVNPANFDQWVQDVQAGRLLPNAAPTSAQERQSEFMFLGLRRTAGVSLREFERRFGAHAGQIWGSEIARYEQLGMLLRQGDMLRLAPRAWFVSNEILQSFC